MNAAGWLATVLDQEMLEIRHVTIAPRLTADDVLPVKRGTIVFDELGGRFLVRYLIADQLDRFIHGSDALHFVTPTPYSVAEVIPALYLPAPSKKREYVMLLDPRQIHDIAGPRWVRAATGIEYLLPKGFPPQAVIPQRWPMCI